MPKRQVILVISDQQAPFMHQDTIPFLRAVKKAYKPTQVINIGDEVDSNAINDFELDPDGLTHGQELQLAINQLRPLYKLFPRVTVLHSNHVQGRLERRRKRAGLSARTMRPIPEILSAPKGWKWIDNLTLKLTTGQRVYFTHGMDSNGLNLTKALGMSVVQGHYHSKYGIQYHSTPHFLNFSLQVGCSVDLSSPAFKYGSNNKARSVVGHAIIVNGFPKLLPMLLDKRGRWIGVVP